MKACCLGFFLICITTVPAFGQTVDSLRPAAIPIPQGASDTTSISFRDSDFREVIRGLAVQHGLNVFIDNAITKRVTVSLNRVPVHEAIKFLCEQNGLVMTVDGGIYKITLPPPPKVEPPAPKVPVVLFERGLLTVRLKNDELEQTLLLVQERSGRNILLMSGTAGSLSGTLVDVDFDIGLTQILNNNGFAVQKKNNIYLVSKLEYFVGNQSGPSQRSGPYWVSVKDSLVTLDVTNAPLERVISDISRQLNSDIVFYSNVTGQVTARASSIPLTRALDLILRNSTFTYRFSDGIYFVGEKTNKALTASKLIRLKYLRAEKAAEALPQSITSQATIKAMKEHNALVAIGTSDVLGDLEQYLAQVDQPVAQVLIEAIVVDYDRSSGTEFGVGAGYKPGMDSAATSMTAIPGIDALLSGTMINKALKDIGSLNFFGKEVGVANLGKLPSDFYLQLRALEQKGVANVKSRPLIATLNGHQASLSIGTTQYYKLKTTTPYRDPSQVVFQETETFQTIEADTKLDITPYVGADGMITVELKPDFRTPVGQLSSEIPPTINRRAMSSTLVMREGETIILGGLIQESESETRSQTPILGDIPLLGSLFSSTSKSTRKSELIIYVTPHISYGEAFGNIVLPENEH